MFQIFNLFVRFAFRDDDDDDDDDDVCLQFYVLYVSIFLFPDLSL